MMVLMTWVTPRSSWRTCETDDARLTYAMPLRICSLSEITSLTWRSWVGVRSAWSRASTSLVPASTTCRWASSSLGLSMPSARATTAARSAAAR